MTQPPLPPPQMPPPEPLDASERALAQMLRSLPVGAPPAELDARILGAARRAVHLAPPRKRDRRWLVGVGTAASALLAIGIMLKTHGPGQGAVFTPPPSASISTPAAAPEPASAPAAAAPAPPAQSARPATEPAAAADATAPVDILQPAKVAAPAQRKDQKALEQAPQAIGGFEGVAKKEPSAFPSVPAPRQLEPPPAPAPPVVHAPAPEPPIVTDEATQMAMPAPPPPPPAPPAKAVEERAEHQASQTGAGRRDTNTESEAAAPADADVGISHYTQAKPTASAETSNAMESSAMKSDQPTAGASNAGAPRGSIGLDRTEMVGSRINRAADASTLLPAVDDDAKLQPAQWIERIRARVKAADRDGARESLHRYRARYPDADIPNDLLSLQQ